MALGRSGFVLVITLGLMALILLLILSLSTFIRVESGASGESLRMVEARQNALLAGMIAVGELQKYLGPDQRATANAEVLEGNSPNLLWLGTFRTIDPANPTATREQIRSASLADVEWLVSRPGDAAQAVDPTSDHSGDPDNFIRIASFTRADNTIIEIFAGKTRISPDSTSNTVAWWVSDESQKARVNIVDEDSGFLSAASQALTDFSSAQKTDLRALNSATLANTDFAPGALQKKIGRLADLYFLPFSPPGDWEPLKLALTSFSESIPVDVTQGRLKQDLSAYLSGLGATISDDQPIIRGNANDPTYVGPPLALNSNGNDLPTFGLIRDWHNLSAGPRLPQTASPQRGQQHFAPVVTRFLVSHLPGLAYGAERETEPGIYDPARLFWRFKPAFILWNPYDHPIAASDYLFQVNGNMKMVLRSHFNQNNVAGNNMRISSQQRGAGELYAVFDSSDERAQFIDFYDFLVEDSSDLLEVSPGNRIRWFNFVVRDLALQPGEVILLTAASDVPYVNQSGSWYFNPANRSNGNLLEAEVNDLNGFIFDPNMEVRRPAEGDGPSPAERQFGYYWPSRADIDNERMYPRFRVWALETAAGVPQIVQDMSIIFDQATDAFGWRLDPNARQNDSPHARGWGAALTNRPAHEITGIFDHLNTTQRDLRSFSNHWRGLGLGGGDNSLSSAAMMDLLNISASSAGTTLRDVGIDESLSQRYFMDRGLPGWTINGAGFKVALNRYGRWSSVSFIHPHDDAFQAAGFDFIYSHLRPSAQPLTSIGQLHSVAFSPHVWQPRQPFGSSQPSPFLNRELSFGNAAGQTLAGRPTTSRTRAAVDAQNALIDLPYALNSSLFDRFFVSTLTFSQLTDSTINPETVLPNNRIRFVTDGQGNFPTASTLTGGSYAFERSAAHLRVKGGFNVNSTSQEAWKLLLSGTFDRRVNAQNGADSNAGGRFLFGRHAIPYLPENLSRGTGFEPEDFNAIRSLSEEELDALATAIVEEVKLRGPFLSLADFVNRRLIPDSSDEGQDWLGLSGTLQAAIDKLTHNPSLISPSLAGFSGINRAYYEDMPAESVRTVASINEARKEHVAGGIPTGYNSTRYRGGPRYLMQRDLLAVLAPLLNVRGDTFTVRAYGESSQGLGGTPMSAKCEIVIQRIAAPVDGDDLIQPADPFGRQFRIVAFHWLEDGAH